MIDVRCLIGAVVGWPTTGGGQSRVVTRTRSATARTDLTGVTGIRTAEQGAAIAIRLATLPDDGRTGQLFDDNGVVPW